MITIAVGVVAVCVFVFLLIRASRDPLNRVAERAVETDDDAELRTLIELRYGRRDL